MGSFMIILCFIISCSNKKGPVTGGQLSEVKDSVMAMTKAIARDVSHDGPVVWLQYFENIPDFYMTSGGRMAFSNIDSITNFLNNTFIKKVSKIDLQWNNIRVDPLSDVLADIGADYQESITDREGKTASSDGYFTALAEKTTKGWKLRNLNWSIAASK